MLRAHCRALRRPGSRRANHYLRGWDPLTHVHVPGGIAAGAQDTDGVFTSAAPAVPAPFFTEQAEPPAASEPQPNRLPRWSERPNVNDVELAATPSVAEPLASTRPEAVEPGNAAVQRVSRHDHRCALNRHGADIRRRNAASATHRADQPVRLRLDRHLIGSAFQENRATRTHSRSRAPEASLRPGPVPTHLRSAPVILPPSV